MRIGVFGGTFDPPHVGHLIVAEYVREKVELDRILFVPTATPPHKRDRVITPGVERVAMVRLAIGRHDPFAVSDMEVRRGGVSFTADTLEELKHQHPGAALFFLLGMDNLLEFRTWKEPERILSLARLVVMTRPGFVPGNEPNIVPGAAEYCTVPQIGISGSEIRTRVREGRSIAFLVAPEVRQFIERHRLYR
jgi:nicotinate-nucleotide adenylyltransferase